MPAKRYFPDDIRRAIVLACREANTPYYGANFIHTDDGEPTASLGRLSGGLHALGVYDDFIVGLDDEQWAVWSDRGVLLGRYGIASTLRVGLISIINTRYSKRARRHMRLLSDNTLQAPRITLEAPTLTG